MNREDIPLHVIFTFDKEGKVIIQKTALDYYMKMFNRNIIRSFCENNVRFHEIRSKFHELINIKIDIISLYEKVLS